MGDENTSHFEKEQPLQEAGVPEVKSAAREPAREVEISGGAPPPTAQATQAGVRSGEVALPVTQLSAPPYAATCAPSGGFSIEPTLVNAQVEFYTHDDDKNDDTYLTIIVEDFRRVVAARMAGFYGTFHDQQSQGPFNLRVLNASTKTSLQRGAVIVRIDPKDTDTWRFNFFLLLTFNDNSTLQASANQIELKEQVRELTFGVGGIAP